MSAGEQDVEVDKVIAEKIEQLDLVDQSSPSSEEKAEEATVEQDDDDDDGWISMCSYPRVRHGTS